jgi:hypothetical protein
VDDDDALALADLKAVLGDQKHGPTWSDVVESDGPRIRVFGGSTADINELIERIVGTLESTGRACHGSDDVRDALTEVFFDDGDA